MPMDPGGPTGPCLPGGPSGPGFPGGPGLPCDPGLPVALFYLLDLSGKAFDLLRRICFAIDEALVCLAALLGMQFERILLVNHLVMFASLLNCRCYIGQDLIKNIIIYLRKKVKLANLKMKMCEHEKFLSLKNGQT